MPTHLDRSFLTPLDFISCQFVSLLSGVDWSLASPFANCPPLGSFVQLLLAFRYPLPVTLRSRAQASVWFRAKTDKGIVCLADHLHSVTVFASTFLCLWNQMSWRNQQNKVCLEITCTYSFDDLTGSTTLWTRESISPKFFLIFLNNFLNFRSDTIER